MLHSDILYNLTALNVPKCAVRLIQSYLTQRTMCIRYKGVTSKFEKCPGGGPQGGLLTGILFCLQVNKAGRPCPLPEQPSTRQNRYQDQALGNPDYPIVNQLPDLPFLGQEGSQDPTHGPSPVPGTSPPELPSLGQDRGQDPTLNPFSPLENSVPLCHSKEKLHKKSYVDDLTLLEKISLSKLVPKERIVGPPDWHDRFHLAMPPEQSILQHQLQDLLRFTTKHSMVLNAKKTKVFPFINSKTRDFVPQLSIETGKELEVIYQLKLVGVVITSDLTWQAHVEYTVKRVNSKLWQLARFRRLGAPREKLIKFYVLKIRSILMFAAVCFHHSLTIEQSQRIEMQQKRSCAIILGSKYKNYKWALYLTSLPRLDNLREEACLKWAVSAKNNPLHSSLFPLNTCNIETRTKKTFREYKCVTTKFYKSAVPAMTRKLNQIM